MIMEIREKFPFLYDISVFIMVEFQKQFQVNIQEDEIGFITLHLMCLAEKNEPGVLAHCGDRSCKWQKCILLSDTAGILFSK